MAVERAEGVKTTVDPKTENLDFRGFDSRILLISRVPEPSIAAIIGILGPTPLFRGPLVISSFVII